ncbi:unnamed protein product [Oikopleura dioica]|uniref:Hexosyltransferase n=1 Tax=Oikopleura dioica TaxID=34765 RepID=E4XM57_OIKDI|nr:unnamed protein product [Oikopleura dioica]
MRFKIDMIQAILLFISLSLYFKFAAHINSKIIYSTISGKQQLGGAETLPKLKFFIDHGSYVPLSSNITKYEIIHSPKENLEDVEIVFGIKTKLAGSGRERRNAVRRSFGNKTLYENHFKTKFVFLVGRVENFSDNWIAEEAKKYDDILYGSFYDSYWNLTFKDSMLFTWTEQNAPNLKFLYRGDDDNFLNPLQIIRFFKEHWQFAYDQAAIWGAV